MHEKRQPPCGRALDRISPRPRPQGTNNEFRRWLESYVGQQQKAELANATLHELRGKVRIGHKLTRDEMNER